MERIMGWRRRQKRRWRRKRRRKASGEWEGLGIKWKSEGRKGEQEGK